MNAKSCGRNLILSFLGLFLFASCALISRGDISKDITYSQSEPLLTNRVTGNVIFKQSFQPWNLGPFYWGESSFSIQDDGNYTFSIDKFLKHGTGQKQDGTNWIYGLRVQYYSDKECQSYTIFQADYVFDVFQKRDESSSSEKKVLKFEDLTDEKFAKLHLQIQCASFTRWIR
jgi:hypothetical protein